MTPISESPTQQQKDKAMGCRVLHAWYGVFKNMKLYKPEHPAAKEAARKLIIALNEALSDKIDLAINNIDGLFIINDSIFIEESLSYYDLLHGLEEHSVPAVTFLPGMTEEEVISSCGYLAKKKLPGVPDNGFLSDHFKAPAVSANKKESAEFKSVKARQIKADDTFLRALDVYEEWVDLAEKTFSKLLEEQNVSLADLSNPLERLFDTMHQSPASWAVLQTTTPVTNLHLQHSVNTMVQSIFLGQQLGFDSSVLKILGLAALLHDVGRLLLPADFTTGYRLMPGDVDFVQLHSRDGASFLAGVSGLPMNVVRAALEHHIGYDGIGYPLIPGDQKPHLFSQIIGLADFSSWSTTSEHYYHKPVSPHRMVKTIVSRAGTQFDPFLVKLWVPFLGLYPPGTRVRLSSGEIGVAVEPNLRNITRPSVAIGDFRGNLSARWLAALSEEDITRPFPLSITGVSGQETDFEPYLTHLSGSVSPK